uniref:Uncharacterized protein n=1 Tax=Tanacetum cinerariifolium TaxID=118510 RepID=A0A699UTX6_TANCI|nr:hypothetical protein [Tanacetum cinerariifolium]
MPISRPLITRPTMRPRSASGASVAAIGNRSCGTEEQIPTSTLAMASSPNVGAKAAAPRHTAAASSIHSIKRLRSSISPSGTTSNMPRV